MICPELNDIYLFSAAAGQKTKTIVEHGKLPLRKVSRVLAVPVINSSCWGTTGWDGRSNIISNSSASARVIYRFLKINVLAVSRYYTALMNRRRKQQGQAVQNREARPHGFLESLGKC